MIPAVPAQTSYSVTISLQGLPSGMAASLYVDGTLNGTLSTGVTRTFPFASSGLTHFASVDYYVPNSSGNNGTRYYCSDPSWSFSGPGNHLFTYSAQYLLTVKTAYSSAVGGGWYNSGSVAPVSLKDSEVDEGQGTRLIFTGWSGDASGSNLTANIFMDSAKVAIASWRTQFLLTINSDPPSVENFQGGGWYDSSAQATFSAPTAIQSNEDSRLSFGAWTGDYSGSSSTGTVVMDRPKVVTAHYVAQYLVKVEYEPQSITSNYNETRAGWYDAGSSVQLGPAPTLIMISSMERLKFVDWVDNGLSSQNVSISILIDKPHRIVLTYITQYYVDVQSSHGSVSGSGWYDKGSIAKVTETPESSWPISYTFSGWNLNPQSGKLTKNDDSWSLIVDQPYTIQAVWGFDFLPIIAIVGGGSAGIAALAASVVLARRRRRLRGRVARKPPTPLTSRICRTCGNNLPAGAVFCQKCGAATSTESQPAAIPTLEDKVYDYIIKHEGVISLSKASNDLGLTVDKLKEITEKLKDEGRLS